MCISYDIPKIEIRGKKKLKKKESWEAQEPIPGSGARRTPQCGRSVGQAESTQARLCSVNRVGVKGSLWRGIHLICLVWRVLSNTVFFINQTLNVSLCQHHQFIVCNRGIVTTFRHPRLLPIHYPAAPRHIATLLYSLMILLASNTHYVQEQSNSQGLFGN
jgi:hypothetical protein